MPVRRVVVADVAVVVVEWTKCRVCEVFSLAEVGLFEASMPAW